MRIDIIDGNYEDLNCEYRFSLINRAGLSLGAGRRRKPAGCQIDHFEYFAPATLCTRNFVILRFVVPINLLFCKSEA